MMERQGQHPLLRERGCDLVQGYWLGHPLEPQAFVALMR
jgi:EAL domain-containing protein (putative c-di-GMP-specific phosphodiesterase class I)